MVDVLQSIPLTYRWIVTI